MAKKQRTPTAASGGSGRVYPPDAYAFQDEVTPEQIEKLREKVGTDFECGDWETIDGLGRIVKA
jgi:hypothetical protein